jgi:2-polyprenyl-3-methyl-5-hydroxy-6-metoxy-1,4-benzoquinol methylase
VTTVTTVNGERFLAALQARAKIFASAAAATCRSNPDICGWLLDPLALWAMRAYGEAAFEDAARGYARYCTHVAQAKRLYEKEGRYNPAALSEIVSEVYEREGYMVPYMWAAILIYAFWPSMVGHVRLYQNFLAQLKPSPALLELASGHGVMGLLAAHYRADARVEGVDISAPAVAIAQRLATASMLGNRARFTTKNALDLRAAGEAGRYQGVIAAMLAEHLERPEPLFEVIAHHLAPDGIAFFSTALESPQRDHVYEFHNESEPIAMAERAGMRVTRMISDGSVERQSADRFRPRALAMLLVHR